MNQKKDTLPGRSAIEESSPAVLRYLYALLILMWLSVPPQGRSAEQSQLEQQAHLLAQGAVLVIRVDVQVSGTDAHVMTVATQHGGLVIGIQQGAGSSSEASTQYFAVTLTESETHGGSIQALDIQETDTPQQPTPNHQTEVPFPADINIPAPVTLTQHNRKALRT